MPPQKKCRAPMAKLALSRTETPVTWVVVPAHPFTRSRVIPALLSRVRENPASGMISMGRRKAATRWAAETFVVWADLRCDGGNR